MTATANATPGIYIVTASVDLWLPTGFALTNTQTLESPGPIPTPPQSPGPAPIPIPSPSPAPGPTPTRTPPQSPTPSPSTTQPAIPINEVVVSGGTRGLRAAIAYANSHPGPDTIIFDPAVFERKHRTIRIVGGPLVVTDPATTTIIGPGARLLTLKGNGRSGVFTSAVGRWPSRGSRSPGAAPSAVGAFATTMERSR